MYFILRFGHSRRPIQEFEFHSKDIAQKAFNFVSTNYDRFSQDGIIDHYTCLLITKGVRHNEETESIEHGSREGKSN